MWIVSTGDTLSSNQIFKILFCLPFNGVFDEADCRDRFDKNFLGGGDDFCSVVDEETADVDPFENRFSERRQ